MHSQQRASNPYSFMKIPLYWQPPIFKFCLHPAPCLSSPKSLPPLFTLFFALFIWLNGWSFHIWCVILFNDVMDLHMLILGTLVPEEPCCVFYTTRHQIYWGLYIMRFFASTLFWYHTYKQRHAAQTRVKNTTCYVLTAAICISLNNAYVFLKFLLILIDI